MVQIKEGDVVRVHYTGKFTNGTPFDSNMGEDPVEFKVGERKLIQGFEEAVVGMTPGETKTVTIPPEKAYGRYDENKVVEVEKKDLPEDVSPEIGTQVQICTPEGGVIFAQITDASDTTVFIDANHPLSEQDLVFEIHLDEIVDTGVDSGVDTHVDMGVDTGAEKQGGKEDRKE